MAINFQQQSRVQTQRPLREDCRGAHAVEFALATFVIALLFLGMADFMRFLAVKTLATKGAQEGLALAEKIAGIDIDLREKCRMTPVEDECKRFDTARELIQKRAALSATQLLAAPSAQRAVAAQALTPIEYTVLSQPNVKIRGDAVFLRPGDSAEVQFSKGVKKVTNGVASSSLPWSDVLEKTPLLVYVCFEVQTMLPLLPTKLEGCSLASGFRYRSVKATTVTAPIVVATMTSTTTTTRGGGIGKPSTTVTTTMPPSPPQPGNGSTPPGGEQTPDEEPSDESSPESGPENGNPGQSAPQPPPTEVLQCRTCQRWLCVTSIQAPVHTNQQVCSDNGQSPCPNADYTTPSGQAYLCCGCGRPCTAKCVGGVKDGQPCSRPSDCRVFPCTSPGSRFDNTMPLCSVNYNVQCRNRC